MCCQRFSFLYILVILYRWYNVFWGKFMFFHTRKTGFDVLKLCYPQSSFPLSKSQHKQSFIFVKDTCLGNNVHYYLTIFNFQKKLWLCSLFSHNANILICFITIEDFFFFSLIYDISVKKNVTVHFFYSIEIHLAMIKTQPKNYIFCFIEWLLILVYLWEKSHLNERKIVLWCNQSN